MLTGVIVCAVLLGAAGIAQEEGSQVDRPITRPTEIMLANNETFGETYYQIEEPAAPEPEDVARDIAGGNPYIAGGNPYVAEGVGSVVEDLIGDQRHLKSTLSELWGQVENLRKAEEEKEFQHRRQVRKLWDAEREQVRKNGESEGELEWEIHKLKESNDALEKSLEKSEAEQLNVDAWIGRAEKIATIVGTLFAMWMGLMTITCGRDAILTFFRRERRLRE